MCTDKQNHAVGLGSRTRRTIRCSILILLQVVLVRIRGRATMGYSYSMMTRTMARAGSSILLPSFVNQTGVVIFYHVAKTGGSTVRNLFQTVVQTGRNHHTYHRYKNPLNRGRTAANSTHESPSASCVPGERKEKLLRHLDMAVQYVLNSSTTMHQVGLQQQTLLLEIHGGSPGLLELATYLKKWRNLSQLRNKPFFAFTLVREPISYAFSYFKFFHVNCTRSWCEHDQLDPTEEDAISSAIPNRQCFLLAHLSAIGGMHPSFYNKCSVTKELCNDVYQIMREHLDWVGTTEALSNDSLPLLSHMLTGDSGWVDGVVQNQNVANAASFEQTVRDSTVDRLGSISQYDQNIYTRVQRDYSVQQVQLGNAFVFGG